MDAHTPTPSDEGAEGFAMTIGLRRWSTLLAAASLLLGSCSASPTTYAERDAADEEARETEDAEQPAPTTAPAEEPMDGTGWILFQAVFDNEVDLGLVRPDSTQLQRLPRGPGNRWHPDWSPDGTRIVYDHGLPDARAEIRTVGVDGRDDRLVDGCEDPCLRQAGPAWSPDGRSIAFDGYEGPTDGLEHERCYLAIYDLDTNEARRIFEWPSCDQDQDTDVRPLSEGAYLRFSPDSERIVFQGEGPRVERAVFTSTVEGRTSPSSRTGTKARGPTGHLMVS
jgi:Tol biopolymer transport system component